MILSINTAAIVASLSVFLVVILLLVVVLIVAKRYLVTSGDVKILINGEKEVIAQAGSTLLNTLSTQSIFLPSACGGGGSCAQCRCQVIEGGGEILPTETVHFTRREIKDNWRLGCQIKVKNDISIKMPESILGVKKWECEVVSNNNVATFIKEFVVKLPNGEHLNFIPGSYIQIDIPAYSLKYSEFDVDERFRGDWDKFNMWDLSCTNTEETMRAYSMANYPAEGDIVMLNVRIATPPFDRVNGGWMKVSPGIASSYIFNLKPGDKVMVSGPFGEFHPVLDTKNEMIYVGGGAGMAPLRAQIMHMTKTLHITDREMHFFYGARALSEAFFLEDFWELEKEYPNFHLHLSLDRPDPKADAAGVKYYAGFAVNCIRDTYLKDHETPEDCEYYLCGPPMLIKTVTDYLDSLGVEDDAIMYDNFG